jgi:hypothetical protein
MLAKELVRTHNAHDSLLPLGRDHRQLYLSLMKIVDRFGFVALRKHGMFWRPTLELFSWPGLSEK